MGLLKITVPGQGKLNNFPELLLGTFSKLNSSFRVKTQTYVTPEVPHAGADRFPVCSCWLSSLGFEQAVGDPGDHRGFSSTLKSFLHALKPATEQTRHRATGFSFAG